MFFFSYSSDFYNPYAGKNGSIVLPLNGSKYGTISDPDIILSQNRYNKVSILIVYEIEYISKATLKPISAIGFEQWEYDILTNKITLVLPPGYLNKPYIISDTNKVSSSPNIAGNNNNDIVVVYETEGDVITQASHILFPTLFSTEINLTYCYNKNFITPDVSLSDKTTGYPPISSYVAIDSNVAYTKLDVLQEDYSQLLSATTSNSICSQINEIEVQGLNKNPRISSPKHNVITHPWECAIVAEHIIENTINPLVPFINGIELYDNRHFPWVQSPFDKRLLNFDPGVNNIVPNTLNEFPVIAYTDPSSVAVAWTYWTQSGVLKSEVISVNYNLTNNNRTPNDFEYYMLVNQFRKDLQYAPSLASYYDENLITGDNTPLPFYSFVSFYNGVYLINFKTSNAYMQPQIRKKNPVILEKMKSDVMIYPNPTNDNLKLNFISINNKKEVIVKLISVDGKLVYEKKGPINMYKTPINVESFKKGIYIIEIIYDNNIKRDKVVIQ